MQKIAFGKILSPIFSIGLFIYLTYHLINGDRGFRSYKLLLNEIKIAGAQLDQVQHEREQLEHRVYLLRQGDKDIITERANELIGFVDPQDAYLIF